MVGLYHEDLWTDPLERDDPAAAALPAVQPDVVGSETGCESTQIEDFRIEPGNLHPERTRLFIPVEREKTVDFLHVGGFFFNRRCFGLTGISILS